MLRPPAFYSPPTPPSNPVSSHTGCEDYTLQTGSQKHLFWAVLQFQEKSLKNILIKDFPRKHTGQITLLCSPQSTHPTHAHSFQTGFFWCLLLKYEWAIKIFEASLQMTDNDQIPKKAT